MRLKSGIRTPLEIPNCVAWYDAFDFPSITESSSLVSQWSDKSGSGWHATASGSLRPTYNSSTLNNRPGLVCNGAHVLFTGSVDAVRNVAGATMFAVVKTTSTGTTQRYYVVLNNTASGQRAGTSFGEPAGGGPGAGTFSCGGRRLDGDSFVAIGGTSVFNNTTLIQTTTLDYTNTTLRLHVNGLQRAVSTSFQTSGSSSNTASTGICLGATSAAAGNSLIGSFGEAILFHRALSTDERRAVEWYLSRKWAVNIV